MYFNEFSAWLRVMKLNISQDLSMISLYSPKNISFIFFIELPGISAFLSFSKRGFLVAIKWILEKNESFPIWDIR